MFPAQIQNATPYTTYCEEKLAPTQPKPTTKVLDVFRDFFKIMMICRSVDEMKNYVETHIHYSFCLFGEMVDACHCKTAK